MGKMLKILGLTFNNMELF